MPIYEYQCLQCGTRNEALQRMSDPPLTTCEACGGELKRLISPPAVQFKGTGWYVTDYARAKPSAKEGRAEGASGSDGGGAKESGGGAKESRGDKAEGGGSSGASSGSGAKSSGGDAKKPASSGN